MRILVLGSGLMGPAAAFNAMADPEVAGVSLADLSQVQLEAARRKLRPLPGGEKLAVVALDLNDETSARRLAAEHDAIVAALPKGSLSPSLSSEAVLQPLVDLFVGGTWARDERSV